MVHVKPPFFCQDPTGLYDSVQGACNDEALGSDHAGLYLCCNSGIMEKKMESTII